MQESVVRVLMDPTATAISALMKRTRMKRMRTRMKRVGIMRMTSEMVLMWGA
jgi:hypothetical protein